MTTEPTPRALRRLRGSCAITTTTRVGYARADVTYIGQERYPIVVETCELWPSTDPEDLETVALRVLWYVRRKGMDTAQARRLVELVDTLRREHGDAVIVHGSATVSVGGTSIAARVERDGSAWYTWADGSKTYNAAREAQVCAGTGDHAGQPVADCDECNADHPANLEA